MVIDAFRLRYEYKHFLQHAKEPSNLNAWECYNMLVFMQQPLYKDCSSQTILFSIVRLLSIKSNYNILEQYFNKVVQLHKSTCQAITICLQTFIEPQKWFKIRHKVSKDWLLYK